MTRPNSILRPLLAALALAALVAGCAARTAPQEAPEPVQAAPKAARQLTLSPDAAGSYYFLAYDDAIRTGRLADAQAAMQELLKHSPTPTVIKEAATLYWDKLHDPDKTREVLKQGIAAYPGSREMAVTLANTYFVERRYDDAETTIRAYMQRVPGDWVAYSHLAYIYTESKRYAEALDALEAIPEDKRDADVLYQQAQASSKLGLNRQAIALLKKAVDDDPSFVGAWAELAFLYETEKDYLAAEDIYKKLVDMGENGTEVWLRLVDLNIKLNTPDKALAVYRQGPQDMDYALEAATLFLDEKFYDQAHAVLDPLPTGDEAPPRLWFYRALLAYEGDQDAPRAMDYLARVPEDSPHYSRAAQFRVHLLIDAERYDEAEALVKDLKDRFPDQADFWLLDASLRQSLDDLDGARNTLEEASKRWPEDTDLLYALGTVLDKMDLRDESLDIMERIITADPEHVDALNYVGYVLADEGRDLDRASVLISKALELEPDSGYIIDSMAWLLFRRGELDKAWSEIKRAVEHLADDPTVWEHYGDVAKARGDAAKAREGYSNSLELNPDNETVRSKLEAL